MDVHVLDGKGNEQLFYCYKRYEQEGLSVDGQPPTCHYKYVLQVNKIEQVWGKGGRVGCLQVNEYEQIWGWAGMGPRLRGVPR